MQRKNFIFISWYDSLTPLQSSPCEDDNFALSGRRERFQEKIQSVNMPWILSLQTKKNKKQKNIYSLSIMCGEA